MKYNALVAELNQVKEKIVEYNKIRKKNTELITKINILEG